jgi:hypothetical protein
MVKFFDEDCPTYMHQSYVTGNLFRYLQIKLLEAVEARGGYAVLGGGEQLYLSGRQGESEDGCVYLEFEPGYAVPIEWSRRNGTSHEPYFFFSIPELCLSYAQHPLIKHALQYPQLFRQKTQAKLFKRIVYAADWPNIKPRPKYNGFEEIQSLREPAERKLKECFGSRLQPYAMSVTEFLTQLSGDDTAV